MAKFSNIVRKFNGGIADDTRQLAYFRQPLDFFAYSSHFDIFTYPYRLTPQLQMVDANTGLISANAVRTLCFASNGKLYGLGNANASSIMKLFEADNYSNFGTWTASTNGDGNGAVSNNTLVEYRAGSTTTSYLLGFQGGNHVFKFDIGGGAINNAADAGAFSYTTTAQGVVHPADDVLYLPYDNKIYSNNAGTYTNAAVSISSAYTIIGIAPYGNYLAIVAKEKNTSLYGNGKSRMWLWDRDNSLTTFSDNIDLGEGFVIAVGNLEGKIVTASIVGRSLTTTLLKIQLYDGGAPQVMKIVPVSVNATFSGNYFQVANNRFYFSLQGNDSKTAGIWCFGRTTANHDYALTLDRVADTVNTGVISTYYGFVLVEDFLYSSFNVSSTNKISASSSSLVYGTGIYESQIFSEGDSSLQKVIDGVALGFQPLPAAATLILKVKADSEANWRTILTASTTSQSYYEATAMSDQTAIGTGYKEIQFRIESTGGAVPTCLKYKGTFMATIIE